MKKVYAVAPFSHGINFKIQVYNAWVKMGGKTMPAHYPWRALHKFAYNYKLPTLHKSNKLAQLRFVEPICLSFDTFPDYARCEIIPLVWDCWPMYFEKTCQWLIKHNVRTANIDNPKTTVQSAPVTIGDDVWIGANCIILKGVTIGARSVIGAGSVVTKSIPADCIAAGNPCRIVKSLH